MVKQTGQCLCGSIQYEILSSPLFSTTCHCTHCQKSSGSAFSINIGVPAESFNITGSTLTDYIDIGGSGQNLHRYFCSQCGSPLYTKPDRRPGIVIVKVGTLDNTNTFKPDINIWCDSKMEWLKQDIKVPEFSQMPAIPD